MIKSKLTMYRKENKSIIEQIKSHPSNKIKIAITDIDGILRGKIVAKEKFLSIAESGFGFCDVVFGWDSSDLLYENVQLTGWHTGYPDAEAHIDLTSYRQIPWENNLPFFLGDFTDKKGDALPACPRSLLRKIKNKCEAMGFSPVFAQEFEWFNFKETPHSLHEKEGQSPTPLTPGMFGYSVLRASQYSDYFNELFDLLQKFNVPLEGLHTETGPGVYEAAILYGDVLEAADRAILFKTSVKEIASRHQIMASFMAKWDKNLPGCSGHVHQSLWDKNKKSNLFYDAKTKNNISKTMESYIAGQLHCMPYILPMYAPTINSYKRLVPGMWAPTTLTWAVDNRTTTLRALPTGEKSTRLETRVVGSDSNPYLAIAACLASGLYGIENKMKLEIPETKGNGYENTSDGILPGSLQEATEKMKTSKLAVNLFGKEFVQHYTATREWECKQFAKVVTDWELKRYFEII